MSRRIAILLGVAVLALGAVGVYYVRAVRPWVVSPPESRAVIDARWRELNRIAAPELRERGDDAKLREALLAVQGDARDVETFLRARAGGMPLRPANVPRAVVEAADLLVQWHRGGGGLGTREESPSSPQRADFRRPGRAAIAVAMPGDARLEAALHLAQALRRQGGVVALGMGFSLVEMALRMHPGPMPAAYAPTDREIVAGLATEALRMEQLAADQPVEAWDSMHRQHQLPLGAWVDPQREIQMLRWAYGARFHAANASRDPPGELQRQFSADHPLPHSMLVRTVTPTFDRVIHTCRRVVNEYRTRVAAPPAA